MNEYLHGADRIDTVDSLLRGRRLGLITNPTGLDSSLCSTAVRLHGQYCLCRIFTPEHGLYGAVQAGEKVGPETDPLTGAEVVSLYGARELPSCEGLDCLLYDIQDVGLRFYTYIYIMEKGMRMAAAAGIPFVVLDRMNPLGLSVTSGTLLDRSFSSGIGKFGLPSRYALTCAELARLLNDTEHIGCRLYTVPCLGLTRGDDIRSLGLPFIQPSPNLPTVTSLFCYVGTVLFEGTNISEGRGTTRPFEVFGAPYIDAEQCTAYLQSRGFEGVMLRPVHFCPTFSKHSGKVCGGTEILLRDPDRFDALRFALTAVNYLRNTCAEFDYVRWGEKYSVDHILGTDAFRRSGFDPEAFLAEEQKKTEAFAAFAAPYRLY